MYTVWAVRLCCWRGASPAGQDGGSKQPCLSVGRGRFTAADLSGAADAVCLPVHQSDMRPLPFHRIKSNRFSWFYCFYPPSTKHKRSVDRHICCAWHHRLNRGKTNRGCILRRRGCILRRIEGKAVLQSSDCESTMASAGSAIHLHTPSFFLLYHILCPLSIVITKILSITFFSFLAITAIFIITRKG